jgi:hypothetical protein
MVDKDFVAEAKRARLIIEPIKGAKIQSFVLEFLKMPEKPKAKVLGLLTGKRP